MTPGNLRIKSCNSYIVPPNIYLLAFTYLKQSLHLNNYLFSFQNCSNWDISPSEASHQELPCTIIIFKRSMLSRCYQKCIKMLSKVLNSTKWTTNISNYISSKVENFKNLQCIVIFRKFSPIFVPNVCIYSCI